MADAGRAAVADQVEPNGVQILGQAGAVEIVGDDLGTRREAGLDPGLAVEAALPRLARHQSRRDEHGGVGCVGAAGDGGRSEEHTSELQSLMRISYAVFCLKKKIPYTQ